MRKLTSTNDELLAAQARFLKRLENHFYQSDALSVIQAPTRPRPPRPPPSDDEPRTVWWPLGFHRVWESAGLGKALDSFCSDGFWSGILSDAYNRQERVRIRVAWKNVLPYAVHSLGRCRPSSSSETTPTTPR